MAKEAIEAVKQAEEQVKLMIEEAVRASKNSKEETIKEAEEEYKKILYDAEESAKAIMYNATKESESISKSINEKGSLETNKILSIDEQRLSLAAKIIIERVVNTNGNS